jgi:NADH dehydrogenase (ubiquinone) 1 alpha subcomplex subunit 6
MTTIPTRLARTATQSTSSAHQRKRVLDLYREWMRGVCFPPPFLPLLTYHLFGSQPPQNPQAPEICVLYSLDVPPSAVREVIRQRFERNRHLTDPNVIDILLHKSRVEYQETMNFWKQEPHVLGPLLNSHRERPHRTFLQKFFEGGLPYVVCSGQLVVDNRCRVQGGMRMLFFPRRPMCNIFLRSYRQLFFSRLQFGVTI